MSAPAAGAACRVQTRGLPLRGTQRGGCRRGAWHAAGWASLRASPAAPDARRCRLAPLLFPASPAHAGEWYDALLGANYASFVVGATLPSGEPGSFLLKAHGYEYVKAEYYVQVGSASV